MHKRIAAVLVVVTVVILVALWWTHRSRAASVTAGSQPAGARDATRGHLGEAAPIPMAHAAWLAQVGAPGRRIAGKVIAQGTPVPGAVVRLGNVTSAAGGGRSGDELAHVIAGADGTFDFGIQAGAVYVVSAEAADKTPAALVVASADPTAKPEPDRLVLDLGPCNSRLYGVIVDASGGGIGKARLAVAGLGGTDASATGAYSLCVPMGDSLVRIVADGYGALELPIHLVGALERNFELVPEAVLAGSVVDEGGRPVPFAHVLAVPQQVEQPHFLGDGAALADGDGQFKIENLVPGRFMLAASAEGVGSSAPKSAVATPGTHDITLVVSQRARVSGHVMMKGTPIPGARISTVGPGLLVRASYSQADGSFVLDGVPFGAARLAAGDYEVIAPRELTVAKAVVSDVVVEVSELASLRGHVTRKGKPIADALVQLFSGQTAPAGHTDSEGAYEIRGLVGGQVQGFAQVFGETAAFAPGETIALKPGSVTEHDFELSGAATVAGVVVDEAGAPVPNVYVRLIDPKGDIGESMTDSKGAFVCTSMLGGGDYRPAVFPSPGARTAFPAAGAGYTPIKLANGDAVIRDVRIAIKNDRLAIAGRVIDGAGAPVADVHVEAIGRGFGGNPSMFPSVRAEVSGAFTIGDLAPGPYTLHAHAADGSEVEVADIPAGTKGVELHLVRPGSIDGELVGFTSSPRVHARQLTAQLLVGNEAVIAGNRFTITGLTPGKYVVEALGTDESDGESVVVKAGAVTKVTLESRGKGSIRGTIVEFATGTPIPGMGCVAARSMGGQAGDAGPAPPQNTTDAQGAFTIPAPIGKARVMCFSPDGTFAPAGGDTEVTATAPATIALKAVRNTPPPSEVGFRIKPLTLPLVIASVDADGPAKAGGLAVGDIVISIDGASVAGLLPSGAMTLAWNHRPGTTMTIAVERAGVAQAVKIVAQPPAN